MLTPARLSQLMVELIFLLLGALVIWLGLHNHINFNPRSSSWLAISIGVIAWGGWALARPGQWWMRWQKWNRGGSLVLLGILMLGSGYVPLYSGKFLALCGVVLVLRGLFGAAMIFKQR